MEEDITKTGVGGLKGLQGLPGLSSNEKVREFQLRRALENFQISGNPEATSARYYSPAVSSAGDELIRAGYGNSRFDEGATESEINHLDDRRWQRQSALEQLGLSLAKMTSLAATTFLDGTIGTAIGAIYSLSTLGDGKDGTFLEAFYNNPFSRAMREINEATEKAMPIYMSEEMQRNQASGQWWKNMGTSAFWGDTIIKNAGFTIGAGMSAIALNPLATGIAGAAVKAGSKIFSTAEKVEAARKAWQVADAANKSAKYKDYVNLAARSAQLSQTSQALVGSTLMAINEGRVEAGNLYDENYKKAVENLNKNVFKHNIKDSQGNEFRISDEDAFKLQQLDQEFQKNKGKKLVKDEHGNVYDPAAIKYQQDYDNLLKQSRLNYQNAVSKMEEDLRHASNTDLALNIPLLTLSNTIQFGRLFTRNGKNLATGVGKNIALEAGEDGIITGAKNTAKEVTFKDYLKATGKGLFMEGQEEINQKVAGDIGTGLYMTPYTNSKSIDEFTNAMKDRTAEKNLVDFLVRGAEQTIQSFKDVYSDPSSWEEFFSGAFMGVIGTPMIGKRKSGNIGLTWAGGVKDMVGEKKDAYNEAEKIASMLNERLQQPNFKEYYQGLIRHFKIERDKQVSADMGDEMALRSGETSQLISDIIMFDKAGKLGDLLDMVGQFYQGDEQSLRDIAALTSSVDDKGNLSGPGVETGGTNLRTDTEEGRKQMDEEIKKGQEWVSSTIQKYINTKRNLSQMGITNDKALTELTYMSLMLDNFKERGEAIVKNEYNETLSAFHRYFSYNADKIKNPPIKKGTSKAKREAIRKDAEAKAANIDEMAQYFLQSSQAKSIEEALSVLNSVVTTTDSSGNEKKQSVLEYIKEVFPDTYTNPINIEKYSKALDDLTKLQQAYKTYNETFIKYLNNPEEHIEHQQQAEEEANQRVQQEEAKDFKEDLKTATNVREFLNKIATAENTEEALKTAEELRREGNKVAEAALYAKAVLEDIREDPNYKEIDKDAMAGLAKKAFGNKADINEVGDNNSPELLDDKWTMVDEETGEAFDPSEVTVNKTNHGIYLSRIRAAQNKVKQDARFKSSFSTPVPSVPVNPAASSGAGTPSTGNDGAGTTPPVNGTTGVLKATTTQNGIRVTINYPDGVDKFEKFSLPIEYINVDSLPTPSGTMSSGSRLRKLLEEHKPVQVVLIMYFNGINQGKILVKDLTTGVIGEEGVSLKKEALDYVLGIEVPTAPAPQITGTLPIYNPEDSGSSYTEDEALVLPTAGVNTPGGHVQDNKDSNQKETVPPEAIISAIPEFTLDLDTNADGTFKLFKDVNPSYTALYDYLVANKAFEFVNEGKLKEGDTIYFEIHPDYTTESYAKTTIFMTTASGQIVGVLKANGNEQFNKLRQAIIDEFNQNDTTKKFRSSKFQSKVLRVMDGQVQFTNSSFSIKSNIKSPIGVVTTSNGITNGRDDFSRMTVNGIEHRAGQIFTFVPRSSGRGFVPVRIQVKHFNLLEYNVETADTPLSKNIIKAIEKLVTATNETEKITAMKQLGTYLFLGDILVVKDGNTLKFKERKKKDDGSYDVYVDERDGKTKVHRIARGQVTLTGNTDADIKAVVQALYSINPPIQILANKLNDKSYLDFISEALFTNCTDFTMHNSWFEIEPVNPETGTIEHAEPHAPRPSQAPTVQGQPITYGSNTYTVDLNTLKIYNDNGKDITSSLSNDTVAILLNLADISANPEDYANRRDGVWVVAKGDKALVNTETNEVFSGERANRKIQEILSKFTPAPPAGEGPQGRDIWDDSSAPSIETPASTPAETPTPQNTPDNSPTVNKGSKLKGRKKPTRLRVVDKPAVLWDKGKELKWLEKVLPQLSREDRIRLLDHLIEVGEKGATAWGMVSNGIMTLSDMAAKGTAYHEAFHIVFDYLLNTKEKEDILKEAVEKFGNLPYDEMMEALAEDFRMYNETREERSLGRKILDFFKELFAKVTNWRFMKPHLAAYYDAINQGKYAKRSLEGSSERLRQEALNSEMQAIKDKAIADGTFMKAPNGKPTNLNERQWLQVRTKAFKNWFGDWEKVNTFNIDAIDTSKVDIEFHDKPWKNDSTKINKTLRIYIKGQHEKGYFELVKDKEFSIYSVHFKTGNADTGKTFGSTKEERNILYEQILNALPDGAELSTWGELSEGGIKALNKIGKNLTKVGERDVKDRKGNDLVIPIFQKGSGVSKVVDENGEPLVVYHGSDYKFTTFNKEKLGNNTKANSAKKAFFAASNKNNAERYISDFTENRIYYNKDGEAIIENIVKTKDWELISKEIEDIIYDRYEIENGKIDIPLQEYIKQQGFDIKTHNLKSRNGIINLIKSNIIDEYFSDKGANKIKNLIGNASLSPTIYEVFLNIKNPKIDSDNKLNYREESYINRINKALEANNDGGIIKDTRDPLLTDIYYFFNPNQAKSATSNNGEFSTTNDDIRYRLANNQHRTLSQIKKERKNKIRTILNNSTNEEREKFIREQIDPKHELNPLSRNYKIKRFDFMRDNLGPTWGTLTETESDMLTKQGWTKEAFDKEPEHMRERALECVGF